ncbi:hypothetical protein ZIOFF_048703 [Zingiber officinale]|uniref:Transposase-associated domain-containing protein n=1 Tax=Zingiber officinale TaxID=94328 RepID=A0A8J5FSV7_ZINOF|nr:hypothetical protein ZIOFF_048703 [Zingiber officinale]
MIIFINKLFLDEDRRYGKSWIHSKNRNSEEYRRKVDEFLELPYKEKTEDNRIYCPCCDCKNHYFVSKLDARMHIIVRGFYNKYRVWVYHGETYSSQQTTLSSGGASDMNTDDNMFRMVQDIFGANNSHDFGLEDDLVGMDEKTRRYMKLLQEVECELYEGCKNFTKLAFIVHLLQLKVLGSCFDNSFTLLLQLLVKVFPHAKLPLSFYEARKITEDLGFTYHTWDVCPNDCMIFRGEDSKLKECEVCESPRYKPGFPRYGYHELQSVHNDTFHTWFKAHVEEQLNAGNSNFSEVIKALAMGPNPQGRSFKAYMINGFHFRTKAFETSRTTQNSGVMFRAKTTSYASRKDMNPIAGEIIYYGVLKNIIQVHYSNRMKFVMFNCDWVDNQRGKMEDDFKFTLVNFDHLMYRDNQMSDKPFIFASQAEQVFYSNDLVEPKWHVILKMSRRDNYDVYSSLDQADSYSSQTLDDNIPIRDEDNAWVREDVVVDGAIDLGQDEEVAENDETY